MSAALTNIVQDPRQAALIKAVGWDRVPAEQRELALALCERYSLDPMLRHVVMIEGKPIVTRDGLLHIAHRSGVFDGMEVSEPSLKDGYWYCTATVWRKDMSRGFTFTGRYPAQGKNVNYAPEMATKTAESHAFRRAFDISAATQDERWDIETGEAIPTPRPVASLSEKVAARRADIESRAPQSVVEGQGATEPDGEAARVGLVAASPTAEPAVLGQASPEEAAAMYLPTASPVDPDLRPCGRPDPVGEEHCVRPMGHEGKHSGVKGTWK